MNVEEEIELSRCRKLLRMFEDAGQGEHNVLALLDHYQLSSMEAEARLSAVRAVLEQNGCQCPCDHHPDERGDGCKVCLACRVEDALDGRRP